MKKRPHRERIVLALKRHSLTIPHRIENNSQIQHNMLRKTAEWTAKWDDRFLEYLYEQGPASAGKLADADLIKVGASYASRRLNVLADHGLITHIHNGVYEITRKGRFYLAGGYDLQSESYLHETPYEGDIDTYEKMSVYMQQLAAET